MSLQCVPVPLTQHLNGVGNYQSTFNSDGKRSCRRLNHRWSDNRAIHLPRTRRKVNGYWYSQERYGKHWKVVGRKTCISQSWLLGSGDWACRWVINSLLWAGWHLFCVYLIRWIIDIITVQHLPQIDRRQLCHNRRRQQPRRCCFTLRFGSCCRSWKVGCKGERPRCNQGTQSEW